MADIGDWSAPLQNLSNNIMNFAVTNSNYNKNRKLLKQQYKYQREAADIAYQRQMDFYKQQLEYNDPSAVRQRYEAAGINPNAAFGTAGSYQPQNAPTSVEAAGGVQAPYVSNNGFTYENPLDTMIKIAQARNIDANTQKVVGDTVEPGLTSEGVRLTNRLKESGVVSQDLAIQQQKFDYDFAVETRQQNVRKLDQSVYNMEQQFRVMTAQYETLMDQHRNNPDVLREIQSRVWMNYAHLGLMQAQADLARKGVYLTQAQIENISQQTSNLASTKALIEEQIKTEPYNRDLTRARAIMENIVSDDQSGNYPRLLRRMKQVGESFWSLILPKFLGGGN